MFDSVARLQTRSAVYPIDYKRRSLLILLTAAALLMMLIMAGWLTNPDALSVQLDQRNLPPSFQHLFGTDWLGRDMFVRVMKGLLLSIQTGLAGAVCSAMIAAVLGIASALFGRQADRIITWLTDLFLSVPHLVALILVAFVCGGGMKGIVIGIALTHWPALARLIRAEAMQLMAAQYVQVSRRLGRSLFWIARRHMLPHLLPQLTVGLILLFPHAILHEAAVTFIGLGLPPHQPAIGIILSESMRYLSSGMWWLAVLPGAALLAAVRAFDVIGSHTKRLLDSQQYERL
ncbi:ABC transporter permease [Paenibacillus sambharensis]|uniref:ABC transporter permease n=2 Tax=Paenibacillus sambharensis TaxID=1803190 RepID=A0A2W1LWQ0_9BACL|nr:ABC transporter permease [Paenibacillus sambharensis]